MFIFDNNGKVKPGPFVLTLGVVLVVALQMGVPHQLGWPFFLVSFISGSLGGLLFLKVSVQITRYWDTLPKRNRTIVLASLPVVILIIGFVTNHGLPDESLNNFILISSVVTVLCLIGLYKLLSKVLDKLWVRFTK